MLLPQVRRPASLAPRVPHRRVLLDLRVPHLACLLRPRPLAPLPAPLPRALRHRVLRLRARPLVPRLTSVARLPRVHLPLVPRQASLVLPAPRLQVLPGPLVRPRASHPRLHPLVLRRALLLRALLLRALLPLGLPRLALPPTPVARPRLVRLRASLDPLVLPRPVLPGRRARLPAFRPRPRLRVLPRVPPPRARLRLVPLHPVGHPMCAARPRLVLPRRACPLGPLVPRRVCPRRPSPRALLRPVRPLRVLRQASPGPLALPRRVSPRALLPPGPPRPLRPEVTVGHAHHKQASLRFVSA